MSFDINKCRFTGKLSDIQNINTKTGTTMAPCSLQCWKENQYQQADLAKSKIDNLIKEDSHER